MAEPRSAIARSTGRSPLPASQLVARFIDTPLQDHFHDWLALKGVTGVEHQTGPWRTAGQRRVLRMTDGSVTQEQLIAYDPGSGWTAALSGFTNRVQHVLARIEDDWSFREDEHGTEVVLTWAFHPRPTPVGTLLTRLVVAPLHRVYLQRILDRLLLDAAAARPLAHQP